MATDFNKKSDAELAVELQEKRTALREFRFNVAGSKNRNVREGRDLRKTIARYLTEVNRRLGV